MTLPQTIIDAVDRFGDRCAEQLQTGAKLAERDRLLAVIEQHMASTPSPKPEWAALDPRWLVRYLRDNTLFDADAVDEMITFAQAAARQAPSAAAPAVPDGWQLGSLLTRTQDDYPGLGAWFGQIWEGDSVVARVYGKDHEQVSERAGRLLSASAAQQDASSAALREVEGKLRALLAELVAHDSYDTEYDGRVHRICPDCGKQDGEHDNDCAFTRARAVLYQQPSPSAPGGIP